MRKKSQYSLKLLGLLAFVYFLPFVVQSETAVHFSQKIFHSEKKSTVTLMGPELKLKRTKVSLNWRP